MNTFTFPNQGTCSRMTRIELADDHTIESIEVVGGCNGNLKGIASLLKGMKAEDAIARMEGVTCGPKPTSCPDQIAKNLRRALTALEGGQQ
ncbi:MAG TPA: TIGR03905 family TSCPD domain-containing protein [Candidatus Faecalibacterium faecipullorum]|uniref:ribonucleoside-diphosphate reductase n=1 Tax=Candidatus Faecalibacterium faecipullorum TaxID=2838578 RepID=A0A9D2MHF0_9FIRM|nr:TIGR03905 family TSCPD domain-containing protein [Candidatus Faecalibacterium faecipullorum]